MKFSPLEKGEGVCDTQQQCILTHPYPSQEGIKLWKRYICLHKVSFRRPSGGRISVTFTDMFTWMLPRFFAFGSTTRLRFALNDIRGVYLKMNYYWSGF